METMQTWGGKFNMPMTDSRISVVPQPPAIQKSPPQITLSREEQLEAKRLAEEANFSFDGYQVVRREFISHRFDPAMTIRRTSITFNNSCISKLENATYIQFLINPTEKKLIIRPCDIGARDAIRWCVVKADKRKSRQITCKIFAERLFDMMGWDTMYRYRLQGMKIHYRGESMYLFDLTSNECFLPQKRDENGKLPRADAILPADWSKSFGMDVETHDMSTKVDFLDGYMTTSIADDTQLQLEETT